MLPSELALEIGVLSGRLTCFLEKRFAPVPARTKKILFDHYDQVQLDGATETIEARLLDEKANKKQKETQKELDNARITFRRRSNENRIKTDSLGYPII